LNGKQMEEIAPTTAEQAMLAEYLRERDVACPSCKYNLRGLTTARCPECGQQIKITITLKEPYLKAWIALVAASCISAGMGIFVLFLAMNIDDLIPSSSVHLSASEILWFCISWYCIASIPGAVIAIWFRRRFVAQPRSRQWIVAGSTLTLTAAAIATLFIGQYFR
jgi:hypothetical protein